MFKYEFSGNWTVSHRTVNEAIHKKYQNVKDIYYESLFWNDVKLDNIVLDYGT